MVRLLAASLLQNNKLGLKPRSSNFPGGPVIKNAPCNSGDAGSILSLGTKIPHAKIRITKHVHLN